jgi:N-acetylmuramoyl-L-alanine amidase
MKKIIYLVIHCTATPEGMAVTSVTIKKWHTSPPPAGRGWKQVGYSDMIHLNGMVENLVPYDEDEFIQPREITNGVEGLNSKSRHVVYVGGMDVDNKKPLDTRTREQNLALRNYIFNMIAHHPDIKVAGHCQFAQKACPSFDVPVWLGAIGVSEKNIYRVKTTDGVAIPS